MATIVGLVSPEPMIARIRQSGFIGYLVLCRRKQRHLSATAYRRPPSAAIGPARAVVIAIARRACESEQHDMTEMSTG
jgi:hypothetical protein